MTSFSDLSLDPRVLQAVIDSGYTTPTPIQEQAIPSALEGRDVLGIAQTGTGKTAAFVLPLLTKLSQGRARARMPRSLVLCPTRELAAQVAEQFEKYSANIKITMALLIGGVSFKDQDKLIDRGVDVLIATPGRLLDHFERGKLMLTGVQFMVVDEADRMLDMGFIPDIERIFKLVPFTRQTLFFSATMAPEITRITQEFLHNPVRVEVARQASASETIEQAVVLYRPSRRDRADSEKRALLRDLIRAEGDALTNGIIFCNRKRDVDIVAKSLKQHGFDAEAMHGDLDQKLRMRILQGFRDGDLKLLIASDVAARGLDIPNVSHVFNFDVPIHSEDYVHRIGRTGRAGRKGKSITLCPPGDEKYLEKIEELVETTIPRIAAPGGNLPDAAPEPEAAAPEAEAAPRSPRSRRTSRSRRTEPAAEAAPAEAVPTEAPVVETAEAPAPEPAAEKPAPSRAPRPSGNRRTRGERGGSGPSVTGLGDHVPAFLLREFDATALLAADAAADAEADELPEPPVEPGVPADTAAEATTETPASSAAEADAETPAEKPAPKKRAPRRRRTPAKPKDTASEATASDEAGSADGSESPAETSSTAA